MNQRTNTRAQVAVVTAAGGGIGRPIVDQLIERGFAVVAVDRDPHALTALVAATPAAHMIHPRVGDMTQPDDVAGVFATADQVGDLKILINGVGSTCDSSLRTTSRAEWQRLFDLNLTSVFECTQAALPLLEAASGDRVIINISSTLATVADPTTLVYGAFKAALEQWTRSLALELAPRGIRVLAVAPGPVADTSGEAAYDTGEFARFNPLGRFATGAEIAALIAFLAAPEAAYVTGTVVRIDGGDSALGIGWGPLQALLNAPRPPQR